MVAAERVPSAMDIAGMTMPLIIGCNRCTCSVPPSTAYPETGRGRISGSKERRAVEGWTVACAIQNSTAYNSQDSVYRWHA
jgi:hypothetical protein